MTEIVKDSGTRRTFATGAQRDGQTGKGRMDLLPVRAIMEVAKVFEAGAAKYEARNWEKGIKLSSFLDSGLRHVMKWVRGDRDEPHLTQACWNFLCLLDTQKRIEEGLLPLDLNDLPANPIVVQPPPSAHPKSVLDRESVEVPVADYFCEGCTLSIGACRSCEHSLR